MKMLKKIFLLGVVAMLALLVGCGGGGSSSGSGSGQEEDDPVVDPTVDVVEVVKPTAKTGNAYLLKYSNDDHEIFIKVNLEDPNQNIKYVWTKNSPNGPVISNCDGSYSEAELIYKPAEITPDVTVGPNREYHRYFKINVNMLETYVYLNIKDSSNKTIETIKFYVDIPDAPPTPSGK